VLDANTVLEDRVRQRTEQLEGAYKELEAFSYSISHDLRSPLTTISGFTQLLTKSDSAQLSEKGRHYLSRIRSGCANMAELMDGLLVLAKISRAPLRRGPVDVSKLSHKLVRELQDAEPERAVTVTIQPGLVVDGDPAMVAVVMQNLVNNAWKYSSKTVQAQLEIGLEIGNDGATNVFVKDNGAGFDMAHASKLFEAFQRLHPDREFAGTGIGLANVKRVVERHGGRVWAQASPGQGAVFRFTLEAPSL
jgi:light-regulated signal transduction histidine kinase (bacteriophytochrome)